VGAVSLRRTVEMSAPQEPHLPVKEEEGGLLWYHHVSQRPCQYYPAGDTGGRIPQGQTEELTRHQRMHRPRHSSATPKH